MPGPTGDSGRNRPVTTGGFATRLVGARRCTKQTIMTCGVCEPSPTRATSRSVEPGAGPARPVAWLWLRRRRGWGGRRVRVQQLAQSVRRGWLRWWPEVPVGAAECRDVVLVNDSQCLRCAAPAGWTEDAGCPRRGVRSLSANGVAKLVSVDQVNRGVIADRTGQAQEFIQDA